VPSVARDDRLARAGFHAGGAVVALVRVDDVDVVALGDGLVGALVDAGAARKAFLGDLVGHVVMSPPVSALRTQDARDSSDHLQAWKGRSQPGPGGAVTARGWTRGRPGETASGLAVLREQLG